MRIMIAPEVSERVLHVLEERHEVGDAFGEIVVRCLEEMPHIDWAGLYWLVGNTLELGPYVGEPTEHTRIPVGVGVCGAAVKENRNQVIQDVREIENYLACSLKTRSEIVVLIRDDLGHILGQIDLDGHAVGAFDRSDEHFLEQVATLLAARR